MTFTEAIKIHRDRQLLPEEEILAEQIAEYPKTCVGRNWLDEAAVHLLAMDSGDGSPFGPGGLTWQRQIALFDCLLSMAREIVEHRVLIVELEAKIGEALKITEEVA